MTKLMEWMCILCGFFSMWYTLIAGYIQHPLIDRYRTVIIITPAICVVCFGLYAVVVVLYRVFTFNNCEEAAKELQEEILLAKEDLKRKGMKL